VPLLIFILAWLGIATPARLNHFRRFAIVLACIAGAFLSPGTDLLSMVMFTIPLLVLYEIGFLGSVLISRRRARNAAAAGAVLLLLMLGGGRAEAQGVPKRAPPKQAAESLRPRCFDAPDSRRSSSARTPPRSRRMTAASSSMGMRAPSGRAWPWARGTLPMTSQSACSLPAGSRRSPRAIAPSSANRCDTIPVARAV
jgi:hypothetical protein